MDQATQSESARSGDDNGGFEVSIDRRSRLLRLRLWGIWSIPLAEQFVDAVDNLGGKLKGAPWTSVVDARKFMVQPAQVLQLRQESLNRAGAMGCTKVATVVESAAYSLQLKRMAGASHMQHQTFHNETAAVAWLRKT